MNLRITGLIAVAVLVIGCGSSAAAKPSPTSPAAPVTALGGSDSAQSRDLHLAAGRYRITWKADQGQPLVGEVIVRHLIAGPNADGSRTNAQAPIVALISAAGTDTEALPEGDYALVVAMIDPSPWTLTVAKVQ